MTSDLLARLRALDTTVLSDASKAAPLRVLDPGIRSVVPGLRLVGPAVTVAAGDELRPVMAALESAGAGDVLVIDAGGERAMAGDLFANEALRRRLAGIVIDGYCRDTAELRRMSLPFYARGSTPRAAPLSGEPVPPAPVRCGGVEVAPGDLLVGDDDGVLVGTADEFAAVVAAAEGIQAFEAEVRAAVRSGESLFSRFG